MRETYIVLQKLNHNAIICEAEDKSKHLFFGKGIGFDLVENNVFFPDDRVQKSMTIIEDNQISRYQDLVSVSDARIIDVVQDIVEMANDYFAEGVNPNLQITLLDHLNFALVREKQNIKITYPFLNELKLLYASAYHFSKKGLNYANQQLDNILPASELSFIVLHIHAALTHDDVSSVALTNQIIHQSIELVETQIQGEIDRESIYFVRFARHLSFAIERNRQKIEISNLMLHTITEICVEGHQIARELAQYLCKTHKICLKDSEIGYLALHIQNIIEDLNKNKGD